MRFPEYAVVEAPLSRMLQRTLSFNRSLRKKKAMAILEEALCNAPALKMFHVSNRAGQIAVGVDAI
jgi:hypothetical protein